MSSTSSFRVAKSTRRTPTCDVCKSRHQKCSGATPRCNNCELRNINCTYSKRAGIINPPALNAPQEPMFPSSIETTGSRTFLSSPEYARLYSQIYGDIVRDLNLDGNQSAKVHKDGFVNSRLGSASLPSFYQEVCTLVEEQAMRDNGPTASQSNANLSLTSHMGDLSLERNLEYARKILRDSLPPQDVAIKLLDLFFNYQNSIFFVCNRVDAQAHMMLMYEDSSQVTLSWFCQMFLIFSVAVQFDDLDDADGTQYHELGRKYMDDAIEESPQNTLWVMRAMLLICFYQPPTKWASLWIYLDAAIRGAQRFQLDLGHNQLKELSDEEYQGWRQLWLTIISFDRWVAIFLGRLPRIKESISRDPIFKGLPSTPSPSYCVMQSHITSLAIISGNILRDMYLPKELHFSVCQKYKGELDTWLEGISSPVRQYIVSSVVQDLPDDQAEAILNLHFMRLGAWMLLTRPLLLKVVKTRTLLTSVIGPILSAISSDAESCIKYAFQLINSAKSILCKSLPPKRVFMPTFFLINAAHIIVLGAIWKQRQSGMSESHLEDNKQNYEVDAIDTTIQILEFCGQRNAFARRYSILIKEFRRQLTNGSSSTTSNEISPSVVAHRITSHGSESYNSFRTGSSDLTSNSELVIESPIIQDLGSSELIGTPAYPAMNADKPEENYTSLDSMSLGHDSWPEGFEMLYPPDEISSAEMQLLQESNEMDFLGDMIP